MKSKIIGTVKYLLFFSVGILLLYLAFRNIDLSRMLSDLGKANYLWVALSLLLSCFAYASRAYRWIILIEPLGHKPGLANTTWSLCAAYFANLAIPRIGEVTRCTALYEVEGTPLNSSLGTVIAERVIDVLTLLLLTVVVIFFEMERFGNFFLSKIADPIQSKFSGMYHLLPFWVWATLVILGLLGMILAYQLRARLHTISYFSRGRTLLFGIFDGLKTVFRLKRKGAFLFHTLLIWVLYYFMTYVCFFSIESTSHLGPVAGLFVLVIGGYGMSAPVQGGIGIYHILVSQGLVLFGLPILLDTVTGKEHSDGLLFATIVHTSQTILILILGPLSLVMLNIAKRKRILKKAQAS